MTSNPIPPSTVAGMTVDEVETYEPFVNTPLVVQWHKAEVMRERAAWDIDATISAQESLGRVIRLFTICTRRWHTSLSLHQHGNIGFVNTIQSEMREYESVSTTDKVVEANTVFCLLIEHMQTASLLLAQAQEEVKVRAKEDTTSDIPSEQTSSNETSSNETNEEGKSNE